MNNIKEAITDRWENSANGYDTYIQGEINTFKEKGWRDLILSEFEQDKLNILDIGTGPGFFSLILSKEGHKLTGIDCSKEMIEVAKKNCKNTDSEFYVMDSHKLDFSDNSFDIIVCRNVTWTLYNPKKAYKEWTRVLKPGGKIIIFDANWYLSYFDENLRKEVEKAQVNYKNKYGRPYESCTKETPDEFSGAIDGQGKEEKTMTKTMKIEGMMCGHCEKRVKKVLEAIDGVESAEVSYEAGTAVVTLSNDVADDVLKKAVEDQDYTVKGIE